MKKTLIVFAALMLAAVSCTKENFAPVEGTTTLEVSLDNSTRTGLADTLSGSRKIYWLEGDKLAWDGVASEALGSEFTAEAALSSATFTWSGVLSKPCNILYPASFYKSENKITLPATQAAFSGADGIATNVLPMYCRIPAEANAPALKSLTGLVKIRWTLPKDDADGHQMKVIEFSGNNNEQVSGVFTIDYSTGDLTSTSTADADKKVTVIASKTATDSTVCTCLLSVPAGIYSKGFTVRLIDQYGHYMDKSKSSSFTVTAGKISVLPVIEFVPSSTLMTVITTADEWNEYAAAYNAGDCTDATITANLDFSKADSLCTITKAYKNILDGKNFEFQNVTTTRALFHRIDDIGKVENVVLGSSYTLNALLLKETSENAASFVKRLYGTLRNCTFNGVFNFSIDAEGDTQMIGGLVSVAYGECKLLNCQMNGSMINTQKTTIPVYHYIGGIVADTYQVDNGAAISGCTMAGRIQIAESSDITKNNPGITSEPFAYQSSTEQKWRVGGIAGRHASKSSGVNVAIDNCETTSSCMIHINSNIKRICVAGIAADCRMNVSNCTNNGKIFVYSNSSQSDNAFYAYIGGIAGMTSASAGAVLPSFINCTNNAELRSAWGYYLIRMGGIIGHLENGVVLNGCKNTARIYHDTKSITLGYLGGIAGYGKTSSTNWENVIENTGDVDICAVSSSGVHSAGGIIGRLNGGGICGTDENGVKSIRNTGKISIASTAGNASTAQIKNAGGVVGMGNGTISNVSNSGIVLIYKGGSQPVTPIGSQMGCGGILGYANNVTTISDANNNGLIKVYATTSTVGKWDYLHLGGVLGRTDSELTITNCSNSGPIFWDSSASASTYRTVYAGGVVGIINKAPSSISGCSSDGSMYVQNYSNEIISTEIDSLSRTSYVGGIVGYAVGVDGSRVNIGGCSTSGSATPSATIQTNATNSLSPTHAGGIYVKRGFCGGIIGSAENTNITNCTCAQKLTGDLAGGGTVQSYGGIAGRMRNSTASSCTVTSTIGESTATSCHIAGFVGFLASGSSISNCNYKATLLWGTVNDNKAVFASLTKAGSTISDCNVYTTTGKFGTASTAVSNESVLVGDKKVVPTGTTYIAE